MFFPLYHSFISLRKSCEVLTKQDLYAIEIDLNKKNDALYLYVFRIDSNGKTISLFPNNKNPIKNNNIRLPEIESEWFSLDENSGIERIILIISKKNINKPEDEFARILKDNTLCSQKTKGLGGKRNNLAYKSNISFSNFCFEHK